MLDEMKKSTWIFVFQKHDKFRSTLNFIKHKFLISEEFSMVPSSYILMYSGARN